MGSNRKTDKIIKIKVWFKGETRFKIVEIPEQKNSFLIQDYLNETYGLTGWHGYATD